MPIELREVTPRTLDDEILDALEASFFETDVVTPTMACYSTCRTGWTIVCDGNTGSSPQTCTTGWTFRCDG